MLDTMDEILFCDLMQSEFLDVVRVKENVEWVQEFFLLFHHPNQLSEHRLEILGQ
jgi:hypothetical protein